jgi:hypothetical protein
MALSGAVRKIVTVTLPAALLAAIAIAAGVEGWVRFRWDERRGTPGFFVSDPVRGQRLAPGYRGWFAGVPVSINRLGLRADREYSVEKRPNTFRILVVGDSVTFGHGSVYEHTYPRLLEDRLREWRPDIDWQVWNAGVPGYNTTQELATLLEEGPRDRPDLVIVGFFPNDVIDNHPLTDATPLDRLSAVVKSWFAVHVRSTELYKRVVLSAASRLSTSERYRRLLDHLPSEEDLLANPGRVLHLREQTLTPLHRLGDDDLAGWRCVEGQTPDPADVRELESDPGWPAWVQSVRQFQDLHRTGRYRIVFFVNIAPNICPDVDRFYDGGSGLVNAAFLRQLTQGTPAVSSHDEFLRYLPSEVPLAQGHALANANRVKADVLFAFLRDHVLGTAVPLPRT